MLPDGSINPGEMTSFNHYALGSVADYLHRVVAGLAPCETGLPIDHDQTRAGASPQLCPGPPGHSLWSDRGGLAAGSRAVRGLEVCLPQGTTAQVFLPGSEMCLKPIQRECTNGTPRTRWPKKYRCRGTATVLDLLAHEAAWLRVLRGYFAVLSKWITGPSPFRTC